ncbi:MAG: hypothetical protein DYH17_05100 [Xanthomonadales bacterium PRO6]|nr:hypothetical protein [Xanthomonadales bacterium]MCE7930733.1 hypothetical protein [Xanthomonadales bacterium PRO6]
MRAVILGSLGRSKTRRFVKSSNTLSVWKFQMIEQSFKFIHGIRAQFLVQDRLPDSGLHETPQHRRQGAMHYCRRLQTVLMGKSLKDCAKWLKVRLHQWLVIEKLAQEDPRGQPRRQRLATKLAGWRNRIRVCRSKRRVRYSVSRQAIGP